MYQKDFYVYNDYKGNYAIHVVIPSLNREYKLIHRLKTLEVINTENSKVESYSDFVVINRNLNMKYIFYYTDNNSARSRGYRQDRFFRKTLNLESVREAIRKVLEIQGQTDYDEDDEATLQELKDWAFDVGADSGDPVVFYVENAQGKIIYDSDFDIDEWMSDEDEIEDIDNSKDSNK